MKLFILNNKSNSNEPAIKTDDKDWVERIFQWILKLYGYPNNLNVQFTINEIFFPESLKSISLTIDSIITDLSNLLKLNKERINYQFFEDLRDIYGMPYEIQGRSLDCELDTIEEAGKETYYKLIIAKSLLKNHERLICSLIIELLKIKLIESKVKYDNLNNNGLLIYLVGIYFGFGVILAQNLISIGIKTDGFWETKWRYVSIMPSEVFAYALAIHTWLTKNETPEWINLLPSELEKEYELSLRYINNSHTPIIDFEKIDNYLNANKLYSEAYKLYKSGEIENAISTFQKIIFIADSPQYKAVIYNNIGYYEQRLNEYSSSIPYFLKSLDLNPNYGYSYDNLGLSYLMVGELEMGKECLDKALKTGNNYMAYSYRNLAIYYMLKNENELAEANFQKSFSENKLVDLLNYFYAKFQLKLGNKEKAIEYLKISIKNGENEAIKMMNEINNN